jgi:hypothetical protein
MDKRKIQLTKEQIDGILADWRQHLLSLWSGVEDLDDNTRDSQFLARSICDLNLAIEKIAPEVCPESLADLNQRMVAAALEFTNKQ